MKEFINCLNTKVYFAENFQDLSEGLSNYTNDCLWVCDTNTARMVRPLPEPNYIIDSTENAKNLNTIEKILSISMDFGLSKNSTMLALGGGTVCDVTGLASSLYMRGCHTVYIPTTLQAMADSSLTNQAVINFRKTKNIIGVNMMPDSIIICPDLLKSLSNKEFYNGIPQLIKYAFLSGNEDLCRILFLEKPKILERDPNTIIKMLALSLQVKEGYLNNSEKHTFLEFGNTYAYALESIRNFSHGEAVAWGIAKAMETSLVMNLCDRKFAESVIKLISYFGFDVNFRISRGEWSLFSSYLFKDSKFYSNSSNFVLLSSQGHPSLVKVSEEVIKQVVLASAGE